MTQYCRRNFIKGLAALPIVGTAYACSRDRDQKKTGAHEQLKKDPKSMELTKKLSPDQRKSMLDQRVTLVMEQSQNCAQSTFFALSEQFGLGGDDILKALTPLPGVAERGETCGAVTGSLMAMGLVFGRDNLEDWESYRNSLIPTNEFVGKFEQEMGSTLCCRIQDRVFGKCFNLTEKNELKEFQQAGATPKCTKVVQKAVNLAAGIILNYNKSSL